MKEIKAIKQALAAGPTPGSWPVLWRYRDSEQCIKPMDGYTPGEGWTPLYDNPQPERKHTDADLAAEYERGRKAGLTQAYDAALAQQERQSHTPETVRKIIEDDRAQRGEPVAWRAWFDKDSGARWLFSLWPDEENKGLEVDWQPLYTAPQPERKPMTDMEIQEAWNDHYLEHDMNEFDYYRMGQSDAERHHGIKP